jgi:hypothetical protein
LRKYYTNLIMLEYVQKEGIFCQGRGWQIHFESNPLCGIQVRQLSSTFDLNGEPAKEIVVYATSAERAQFIADLVLAAHCLYGGELSTFEQMPVFENRATTTGEIAEQLMAGGGKSLGVHNLPISCLITAKASQRIAFQLAIFKYLLSCQTVPLSARALDPEGDWESGKVMSGVPRECVFNANAIVLAYSVLEELSFEIRASEENPSMINGHWNPQVRKDLEERLTKGRINLLEHILWHLRDTPTKIERKRSPVRIRKCEWAGFKVRDVYLDVVEAIAYASWLRSRVSSHALGRLARSPTIYDVANVQHLARRLLLETLGFWRYYSKEASTQDMV